MKPIDLARPPPVSQMWVSAFMARFVALVPSVDGVIALEHALGAHNVCWLLSPDEAAELWIDAVRHRGWLPCG